MSEPKISKSPLSQLFEENLRLKTEMYLLKNNFDLDSKIGEVVRKLACECVVSSHKFNQRIISVPADLSLAGMDVHLTFINKEIEKG